MQESFKVIIVDDHPIIRSGLVRAFSKAGMLVLAEIANGADLLKALKKEKPDFITLDIDLPGSESGISLIPKVRELQPTAKILMFTMHQGEGYFKEARKAGADAYILKSEDMNNIVEICKKVKLGEFYCSSQFSPLLKSQKNTQIPISSKEHEVLTMIINGFTAKEIGERMGLSKRTVEYYSRKLKEKFDAENLVDLVNRAREVYYN